MEPNQDIGPGEFGVVWWVITLSIAFWAIAWIVFHYWQPSKESRREHKKHRSNRKRHHRHREQEEIVVRPEAPQHNPASERT